MPGLQRLSDFFVSKPASDLIISYFIYRHIGYIDRSYLIQQRYVWLCLCVCIYIYICVCVCVCVFRGRVTTKTKSFSLTRRSCLLWGLQDEVDDGATGEDDEIHELCLLGIPLAICRELFTERVQIIQGFFRSRRVWSNQITPPKYDLYGEMHPNTLLNLVWSSP